MCSSDLRGSTRKRSGEPALQPARIALDEIDRSADPCPALLGEHQGAREVRGSRGYLLSSIAPVADHRHAGGSEVGRTTAAQDRRHHTDGYHRILAHDYSTKNWHERKRSDDWHRPSAENHLSLRLETTPLDTQRD